MTQKELNIINNILEQIEIPEHFGTEEEGGDWAIEDVIMTCERNNWSWATGASKFVIIPDECDYVIKIPFNGFYEYFEDYDEETDEYFDGEDVWTPFTGAYGNGWDYCNAEVLAYADAEEAGFENFLAETKYIGKTSNGYPAYAQEKVRVSWAYEHDEGSRTPSPESSAKTEAEWEAKFRRFADKYWLGLALDDMGEDKVQSFIDFAKKHDCIGTDIHSDNYGFRNDGQACLLDYSGYWS